MVGLDDVSDCTKMYDTPAISTTLLDNDLKCAPCVCNWNYRSVVGALSYVQANLRPDITFVFQHCARFFYVPNRQHEDAVK